MSATKRGAARHATAATAPIAAVGARVCVPPSVRVYVTEGEEWYGTTRALRLVRADQQANPLATRYVAPATRCEMAPTTAAEGRVA